MGIVYKTKIGSGYINKKQWHPVISRTPALKASRHPVVKKLTSQNRRFLISLGLRLRQ